MKVGIFDSGLGGLSVLHCAKRLFPGAEYIYYADEEHVPYGEKSPKEIRGFVEKIFHFLIHKGVDAIVIACNTATTMVDKEYRKQFSIPIVGMEPAVKKAVELYGEEGKRILVAATPVTIQGNKLKNLVTKVDTDRESDLIALPGLVHFAEKTTFNGEAVKEYLKKELSEYSLREYGTVVLGCTHFNYFKEVLQEVFPEPIHFVDGNEGTIHQLMRLLSAPSLEMSQGSVDYYVSGRKATPQELQEIAKCMKQLDRVDFGR